MSRRREANKREVAPDPKYNSQLAARFINGLMGGGKKSTAESIFYKALDIIEEKTKEPPLKLFTQAMDNVKPMLEVKSRRVGGATYQVPVDVRPDRRTALAIRWIIHFAGSRKGLPMEEKLARELMEGAKGEGASVKKKEDTHRMADANKAFAHYRW
ncbi:30S ribosomal protein S7 [candidate division NPL-UPA2 bacterium]|nr:30S ribosomal protein S7 [candidate division NPL-UPA2 bacterium]